LARNRAVAVAAELGLADLLAAGALHADVLAERTGSHAPSLFRLLRALASIGVFAQVAPHVFANSPMSELLRQDVPGSLWAAARGQSLLSLPAWVGLTGSIRTRKPAFDEVHGQTLWSFMRQHPEAADVFDKSMRALTTLMTPAVTAAYDWSRFPVIADIGGGIGTQLVNILQGHSTCRGLLFDLPEVLHGAIAHDRVERLPGDFFKTVPGGADAYMLRSIIHDWPEPAALNILSNVRSAMTRDARLFLIEMVIPETTAAATLGFWADLLMLVVTGGRERTASEYKELLNQAGFEIEQIVPTTSPFSIIVATKTDI
jgi:hypothetical protein